MFRPGTLLAQRARPRPDPDVGARGRGMRIDRRRATAVPAARVARAAGPAFRSGQPRRPPRTTRRPPTATRLRARRSACVERRTATAAATRPGSIAAASSGTCSGSTGFGCRGRSSEQSREGDRGRRGRASNQATWCFSARRAPGASHVGMAIGGDEFVHAPSSRGEVRVERLSAPYWASRYVGARRMRCSDARPPGPGPCGTAGSSSIR